MTILLHRVSLPLYGGSLNRCSTVSAAKIFLLFQEICIVVEQVGENDIYLRYNQKLIFKRFVFKDCSKSHLSSQSPRKITIQ